MKRACLLSFAPVLLCTFLLAQSNPVPLIYQPLIPASVAPGSPAFTLTVHGSGFVSGASVKANGVALRTKFVDSNVLKAHVAADAVAKAGTASITVANPGSIDSNVVYFCVRNSSTTVNVTIDSTANIEGGQVVVGDFNNDHKPDVSVASLSPQNNGLVDVYLGHGNGAFSKIAGPSLGLYFSVLLLGDTVGDVNNDGNLDTTVCSSDGGPDQSCDVYLGDGKGGLTFVNNGVDFSQGVFADINGDGILDYVDCSWDGYFYYIDTYLGNGDGTFRKIGIYQLNTLGNGVWGIPVVGDFNADGKLDVAVSGTGDLIPGPGTVAVLLGNGDGTLQSEVDYQTTWGGGFAAVADLNGDGKLDIIVDGLSVLLGKGDGTFRSGASYNLDQKALNSLGNVQVADVNGDGNLDVVVAVGTTSGETLAVFLGDGHGHLQTPITLTAGTGSSYMGIADFNGDGLLDFVVSGSLDQSSPTTVLLQTAP
jgi:hypothetical protein